MLGWQQRLNRWLDKRIPAAQKHQLGHKNAFIFPSRFGGLYLFLCVGLFVLGTNYQNNLMILLCYFLLSLFLLNLFLGHFNFARLEVQLGKVTPTFVAQDAQLPIWINHTRRRPHGLLQLHYWQQKQRVTIDLDAFSNPLYLPLRCDHRGYRMIPRVTLESVYPLGLFRCWTHLAFDAQLLVYPQPIAGDMALQQLDEPQPDEFAAQSTQGHDDFDSLAPYKQGEPLYHVAWKQVAKGQGMISKHFSQPSGAVGYLRLPHSSTQNIELSLGQLCYQVIELTRQNQRFGLLLGNTQLAPDIGPEHESACLKALALYSPDKGVTG